MSIGLSDTAVPARMTPAPRAGRPRRSAARRRARAAVPLSCRQVRGISRARVSASTRRAGPDARVSAPEQTFALSSFSILSTSAARGYGSGQRFRRIGRVASELEADQMILLVAGRRAGLAVFGHLLHLERSGVTRPAGGRSTSSLGRRSSSRIVACVTSGLSAPGVSVELASTAAAPPPPPGAGRPRNRRTANASSPRTSECLLPDRAT